MCLRNDQQKHRDEESGFWGDSKSRISVSTRLGRSGRENFQCTTLQQLSKAVNRESKSFSKGDCTGLSREERPVNQLSGLARSLDINNTKFDFFLTPDRTESFLNLGIYCDLTL